MTVPATAREHLTFGLEAITAGNFRDAEFWLRRALEAEPDHAEAHFHLARLLAGAGRFDEAQSAAEASARQIETLANLDLLAKLALRREAWEEADRWLAKAQRLKPASALTLSRRGDAAFARGFGRQAAEHYAAALQYAPDDFQLLSRYCNARIEFDIDDVVAATEAFIARSRDNPTQLCRGLWLLLPHKERALRRDRGLAWLNGDTTADLHFRFATAELARWLAAARAWAAAAPDDAEALWILAQAVAAVEAPQAAEPALARLRGAGHIADAIHFSAGFFDALTATPAAGLPAVVDVVRGPDRGRVLFAACDPAFFETYGWAFVKSVVRHASDVALHLHIFDATAEESAGLLARLTPLVAGVNTLSLTLSTEWTGLRAGERKKAIAYYHVARFVRFFTLLERTRVPVWQLDMDVLFRRSAAALFERLEGHDTVLWLMPGRTEFNNHISACMIGMAPSEGGRGYLRAIAAYIAACLRQGEIPWGTDQAALFSVLAWLIAQGRAPDIVGLPAALCDGLFGEDCVLWPGKCAPEHPRHGDFAALVASF